MVNYAAIVLSALAAVLALQLAEGGEWSEEGSDALVIGFEGLFLLGGILFGLAAREYSRSAPAGAPLG